MQDVEENMDDLFRKAAEDYMLKEGESSWNEIAGRLGPAARGTMAPAGKKTRLRNYAIAILLLLTGLVGTTLFYKNIRTSDAVQTALKPSTGKPEKAGNVSLPLLEEEHQQHNNTSLSTINSKDEPVTVETLPGVNYDINHRRQPNTNLITTGIALREANATLPPVPIAPFLTTAQQPAPGTAALSTSLQQKPAALRDAFKQTPSPAITDTAQTTLQHQLHKKHAFYYGLTLGVGFTTVKNQEMSKPGPSAGLTAGYRLTPASSVELSLLHSRKYYASDGQYFKMDKMKDMPADMKVMHVNSNTSIFEIPVNFKYNILNRKHIVYAAAGVTSYILTHEKNDYVTATNGTMGSMQGNYKTTSGYFAGGINLAAGYEHALGKNSSIRVEPFITIPTRGIGIGSLPVTTSGIHLSLTGAFR